MNQFEINSKAYWEQRFSTDWDSLGGPNQSRFFARLAAESLPDWFTGIVRSKGLTICDWGCAEGDGTNLLASYFATNKVSGVDFSKNAINMAISRYPWLNFSVEDWTKDGSNTSRFDVIYSSNTLEHFIHPYEILARVAEHAKQFIVLLLPYQEFTRIPEHHYTFLAKNIPSTLKPDFHLVYAKVLDARLFQPCYWEGQQIILIYGRRTAVVDAQLTLADIDFITERTAEELVALRRTVADRDVQITSLNQAVAERDGQIVILNQLLSERDGQIASLKQGVAERDGQIVILNQLLSERDEQIASLKQGVAERDSKIANVSHSLILANAKNHELISSTSWRITSPARQAKILMLSFINQNARYTLLKSIYWKLPEPLRRLLNNKRHKFVARHLRVHEDNNFISIEKSSIDSEPMPAWITRAREERKIAVIPCAFEFDELVNQRPINAAKHYSSNGFLVLYIAWQWSPQDSLTKGAGEVYPNVIQVPLYDFLKYHKHLSLENKIGHYIATLPSRQLIKTVDQWRSEGGMVIYDIMDEWEEFASVGQAPWYEKKLEQELLLKADFVTVVSPALKQKFQHIRTDIAIIGNGYCPSTLGTENKGIANKNHSDRFVIGYFGHLTDSWFDWDMLFSLAKQLDYHFEIIGYGEPEWVRQKILQFDNVSLVGKVPPSRLHTYVSRWKVGIIPFVEGNLSHAVDPIKIYEYLYFGLPVVATGISHLKDYPRTYFATRSSIREAISQAIADTTTMDELEIFLSKTTWKSRFDSLMNLTSSYKTIFALYEH